ncbi:hypothetical protein GQ53DRAFT_638317 [Thozetella sp. PMI_491]|nr:hypothetical protein GQ53DRAFT_638317 [Thozetella sp. PMI_491]
MSGLPPRPGQRQSTAIRQSVLVNRRRTFHPVNYADYKTRCDEERIAEFSIPVEVLEDAALEPPSFLEQVSRMFTIFPYRDINWLIAIAFGVGGLLFTVGAVAGLLFVLDPTTMFDSSAFFIAILNAIAGSMFLTAGFLSLPAAWNADKGTLEPIEIKVEDGPSKIYKPALLGSSSWAWIPSRVDFNKTFKTIPFQAGLIMLLGGAILSTSVVAGFPGVLDPTDAFLPQVTIFLPLTVGGSLFVSANLLLMFWLQPKWYLPAIGNAAWQGAFWSTVGSLNFALTGLLLFQGDVFGSSVTNLVGSAAFLIGSIIQWYDLMGFHPDSWAS